VGRTRIVAVADISGIPSESRSGSDIMIVEVVDPLHVIVDVTIETVELPTRYTSSYDEVVHKSLMIEYVVVYVAVAKDDIE